MLYKKIKSFTLSELILVVAIIGVLTLGMTAYMGNSGERAKIIEAQGCANTIGGVLKNYVYNALTSKNLKVGDEYISPEHYFISLKGEHYNCTKKPDEEESNLCDDIILGYSGTLTTNDPESIRESIEPYQTINTKNTCHHGNTKLSYYWSGGTSSNIFYINMNKGFTQKNVSEKKVFYLHEGGTDEDKKKLLIGDIIVVLCYDKECSARKHIGRRHVDARSQTIEFQKCKFYKETNPIICKTREGETDDET